MGNQLVVQRIESDGCFWTVELVQGLGGDGDFLALFDARASVALIGNNLHNFGERFAVFGDAKNLCDFVGRHTFDVGHVAVRSQFVGVFVGDSEFN